jgi:hypothetical protein
MAFRQPDLNHCRQRRKAGRIAAGTTAPRRRVDAAGGAEMLKALLTPIVLGLTVAMVIRLMRPRRAY